MVDGIFLDTSIYEMCNYDFKGLWGSILPKLKNICTQYGIQMFCSPIIKNEIMEHLRNQVTHQCNQLRIAFNENKEIMNKLLDDSILDLLTKLNELKKGDCFVDDMEQYFQLCSMKYITTDNVNIMPIFEHYFKGIAPFKKDCKKKAEFPDAFVIQSILDYVKINDIDMLVISSDSDWENALEKCENIIFKKSLNEGINFLTNQSSQIAEQFYELACEDIFRKLETEILYCGHYCNHEDSEVVDVNDIFIETIEDFCLLEKTTEKALISANAIISLTADIEVFDEENSIWDCVDKEYYFEAHKDIKLDTTLEISFEAEIHINEDGSINNRDSVKIANFNNNHDIEILLDDEDFYAS